MQLLERVAVGDDFVEALRADDGQVLVSLRRVCEALGLDADTQRRKLAAKPWACTVIMTVHDTTGRAQPATLVALKSLPMWLANIDESRVDPRVAFKLRQFQLEAHDVLAAHFAGMGSGRRAEMISVRPSGGAAGSGARPTTAMSAVVDDLAVVDALSALAAAIRTDRADVVAVRAEVALERAARTELERQVQDNAAATARLAREQGQARESRRRIDAAVGHCTRTIKRWCAETSTPFQKVYSEVRSDLGLRRTLDGGPALGKAKLRADQVLRMARCATNLGVTGLGVAVIEALLNGSDDVARPGFIDVDTTDPARAT